MKIPNKHLTIMLVPDGAEGRVAWRMRQWHLYLAVGLFGVLVMGILVFFMFYGKVVARAAVTERVQAENESLLRYRYKVQLLEENLKEARQFVSRLATMAGVDVQFPEFPDDSVIFAQMEKNGEAVMTHPSVPDWTIPSGLPVKGFVTQDFEPENTERYHPGVDIACAIGTPVLATGSGVVAYAGDDSTYGKILLIRHNDSITTVYGHNDSILVSQGQSVLVGSRIALSGNTGKSTAPHLHYEIRIHDEPINPLDDLYDKENQHNQ